MSHEIVGHLIEQGYDEDEVRSMLTPMEIYDEDDGQSAVPPAGTVSLTSMTPFEIYDDGGSDLTTARQERQRALRAVLSVARDSRQRPGPQLVAHGGLVKSASDVPKAVAAKAVRVDTENTYRDFRRSMTDVKSDDLIDALSERAQSELMGESHNQPTWTRTFPGDQVCLLCAREGSDSAICAACRGGASPAMSILLGFGDRGAASEDSLFGDFGDRGAASEDSLFDLPEILGDVLSLESPLPAYDELRDVPLSFRGQTSNPDAGKHINSWRHGSNLYSSIRVTGWDGEPRILTATAPYGKAMGVVVGYAERAALSPTDLLGLLEPLAEQDGASRLIPRLAAASPAVLLATAGRQLPVIVGIVPAQIVASNDESAMRATVDATEKAMADAERAAHVRPTPRAAKRVEKAWHLVAKARSLLERALQEQR